MQPLAYPCLVMASLAFFVGVFHFVIFASSRRQPAHLPFAFLCVCVAFYDVFSIGLYDSTFPAQGLVWQELQLQALDFICVFLTWFVFLYLSRPRSWVFPTVLAWFALLFVLSMVLPSSLTLSIFRPAVTHAGIPGLFGAIYYEGALGPPYLLGILSAVGLSLYLIVLVLRTSFVNRVRRRVMVTVGLCVFFAGVANNAPVALHVYGFFHLDEYAFMIAVLCMFSVLVGDLTGLYREIEQANATLESRVEERTAEIRRLNEDLRRQAELDPLTGIYNRRFFGEYLDIELRRARNRQEHKVGPVQSANDMNFGLAMIDIDHFKRVNDTWGHPAGDRTIVEVVRIIQGVIFSRDVFCRYGGEEFVILFTRTSREGILQAIEKIRKTIEEDEFVVTDDGRTARVTVSIGAVIFDEVPGLTTHQFLRIADNRLLAAKNAGRNVVVCT